MNQLTDSLLTSLLLVPAIVGLATTPAPPQCRVSEFPCSDSRCIPLTSYCNSVNDCGDSSDEPRFCTPCNRTYYGDVGKTYEIELHRPKEDRMPFVCHLTLAAGSGDLGDLVQVTFERFTLGRFDSFIRDGCPDGEMQIWEWDRPRIGGSWCGTSWGPSVYFSETRSVTVSLRLLRIARDQSGYNFDFKMSFKMLPKKEAIVRYGGFKFPGGILESNTSSLPVPTPRHYLGELIDGTFCSRVFTDCNRKDCRLQSPNFPGIYPRNLTCYYAVRQQEIPAGKHALISVRQGKGQLINIRSQATLYTRSQQQPAQVKQLKVWEECDQVQDYVTIYDGYTTRDPVLLKFCGGGSSVPETISSGHELLVEFSTSPYGTFLYPAPPLPLNGFQLQVQVKFVDKDAPKYARNKRCEFWLRGTGKGILESPRHSLAGNTTCLYHLQGADPNITPPPRHLEMLARRRTHGTLYPTRYKVWLAVLKYHVSALSEEEACSARLQIWDGNVRAAPSCNDIFCDKDTSHGSLIYTQTKSNLTLLARYCKDHVPRSCDHSLLTNSSRSPRPCSLAESFLSTGDSLTLELKIRESTALRPVSFRALYEFVDLQQDGEPYGTAPCSRRFVSRSQEQTADTQTFGSPKDVFLYGRGGATNLSCVYRFEAQKGENIRIILTGLQTGVRKDCTTRLNPDSSRLQCVGNATAYLHFWDSALSVSNVLPRDCLCSSSETFLPFTFTSAAHIVEVKFNVIHMSSSEDFRALHFEARYEFVRSSVCTRRQKVSGPSGEIFFRSPSRTPEEVNCEGQPWVITPRESRYLYVQIRGVLIRGAKSVEQNNITSAGVKCTTKNRVLIHSGSDVHVLVCPLAAEPQRHHLVEVFSEGWVISSSNERLPPVWSSNGGSQARSIMVEFISKEPGMYSVTWLELSRRASVPAAGLSDCPHRCPELDACINSSLWCDGTSHCPSGYDEAAKHCFYLLQLPLLYLAVWTLGLFSLIFVVVYIICRICKRNPRSSRLKSLPSDTEAIVGTPKEVIC